MNSHNQCKTIMSLFIALVCFGVLPAALAVSPAPDGGYPNNNTAEGTSALLSLTTGSNNSAVGFEALKADTSGRYNTATGIRALWSNSTAHFNTADGAFALVHNTASYNTATGAQALYSNTSGDYNTASGYQALFSNVGGEFNTAIGEAALFANKSGGFNTATGLGALLHNINGSYNTAVGMYSLYTNSGGTYNTAVGYQALFGNTTATGNIGIGNNALLSNSTGGYNTALGNGAGSLQTTGSSNVYIGADVPGVAGENSTTYISNVYDSLTSVRAVYVNSDNKLGTLSSSRRYKQDIKSMAKASESILALNPVTFRYNKEIDSSQARSFGLIAEEVADVNPDLITRDRDGKPQTVRYDAVNAMLLNEFLKEHRKVEQLKKDFRATIAQQQKEITALAATVKAQAALIQKVNERVEMAKSAPRMVANDH